MEGEEREEAVGSACTYSRGVEGFFNDVTLTKCVGGAPTLPDYTSQSSGCQRVVTPVTAWVHSETLLFRPETRDAMISRRVESLWRSKLFALVSGDRHKLPKHAKPIRKTRLPEVRKCMCFQKSLSTRSTFFATLSKRNDFQNFCNQHSVLTLHMFQVFSSFAEWCEGTKNI